MLFMRICLTPLHVPPWSSESASSYKNLQNWGVIGVRLRTWLEHSQKFVSSNNFALGHTDINNRTCVVVSSFFSDDPVAVKDTIAHEIGHVILGAGHPGEVEQKAAPNGALAWVNGGVAPLIGTKQIERLMCSGGKRAKDGSSRLLVKKEWDAAELWFIKEKNGGRMD